MIPLETVPCETCGKPTPYTGTKRCNNCWEVEGRFNTYMLAPKALDFIRQHIPKLDDWVDGHPDAWDYNKVLSDNNVVVEWCDQMIDGEGTRHPAGEWAGWSLCWKHGVIFIGRVSEIIARKAAAMFVSLWLRGVSASFADKLMDGFINFLELQENTRLTFLAEIMDGQTTLVRHFLVTHKGLSRKANLTYETQNQIITALGDPKPDEEIIVTFTKRKKQ